MALSVTHTFVSAVPDEGNPGEIEPSHWNATHNISGTLPAANVVAAGGAGDFQNNTGGTLGAYTATQATAQLNVFTATLNGLAPLSGGGIANFLRADGTWAAPGAAGSITVGVTTIGGGVSPRVLYDNGGLFGEAANFTIVSNDPNVVAGGSYRYNGVSIIRAQTALGNFYEGGAGNLTGTGTNNLATGAGALASVTTGFNNTAIGPGALNVLTTGDDNLAIGQGALGNNALAPTNCIAIGANSMASATGGSACTAIGAATLQVNTTGANNVALGANALLANTSGSNNLAVGASALQRNTTASQNVAIGQNALANNLTGGSNVAIGQSSLASGTTTNDNIAIGVQALNRNIDGANNIALGRATGFSILHGAGNTGVGFGAIGNGTDINSCTAIGYNALTNITADNNTALGYQAGQGVTSGTNNLILGFNESTITTGSNNIAIGQAPGVPSATASNQLVIQNIIYGTGNSATGATISTGSIGIGVKAPVCKLDVNGSIKTAVNTVAGLPAAGNKGAMNFVSDATATTFATIAAGGGANNVPVYDDGTNWRIG